MSFAGGGSDLPSFYRKFCGAVVSTAINKYVYVTVNPKFDHHTRVSYSHTEEVETIAEIKHPLVRESMKMLRLKGGIEITSIADIPSRGTGLGSSSSFTVGLLHALHAFQGRYASADRLAKEACEVEIGRCGEPIGKQDQYAAAYGGLNFIEFHEDDTVSVDPIVCKPETLRRMDENIICFYTGIIRSASGILKTQQTTMAANTAKQAVMKKMVQLARDLRDELVRNNVDSVGEVVHANWELKRSLTADISNSKIDHWYSTARKHGAIGGKLLGAGSGGFMMFYAPRERHGAIARGLKGLRQVQLGFERQGSKIIFVYD
jgi:D-glycero-alpha-D-manno-heptose-7-phosphate kinase